MGQGQNNVITGKQREDIIELSREYFNSMAKVYAFEYCRPSIDKAIGEALDFAEENGNTLVVITADHETGGMSLIGGDLQSGEVRAQYGTTGHSSVPVLVYAFGPGAEEFSGIYENTEIFEKFLKLYGFIK